MTKLGIDKFTTAGRAAGASFAVGGVVNAISQFMGIDNKDGRALQWLGIAAVFLGFSIDRGKHLKTAINNAKMRPELSQVVREWEFDLSKLIKNDTKALKKLLKEIKMQGAAFGEEKLISKNPEKLKFEQSIPPITNPEFLNFEKAMQEAVGMPQDGSVHVFNQDSKQVERKFIEALNRMGLTDMAGEVTNQVKALRLKAIKSKYKSKSKKIHPDEVSIARNIMDHIEAKKILNICSEKIFGKKLDEIGTKEIEFL